SGWGEPTHQPGPHTVLVADLSEHVLGRVALRGHRACSARRTASGTATALTAARVRVSSAVAADVGPKGEPSGSHTVPAAGTSPVTRYRVTWLSTQKLPALKKAV